MLRSLGDIAQSEIFYGSGIALLSQRFPTSYVLELSNPQY